MTNENTTTVKLEKKYLHGYYLCQLPQDKQNEIMNAIKIEVEKMLLTDEEKISAIENAECEKVCNLTDTINFEWV